MPPASLLPALCALLPALLSPAALAPPAPNPVVTWQISSIQPTHAGARLQLTLTGHVDPAWHIYALQEPPNGPNPTTIALAEGDPAELLEVTEARPHSEHDPAFDAPTQFFTPTAVFHLRLRLASAVPSPTANLHVLVRYQSCTGETCLPPHTDVLAVAIPLKPVASS